jgi:hypothetical protein
MLPWLSCHSLPLNLCAALLGLVSIVCQSVCCPRGAADNELLSRPVHCSSLSLMPATTWCCMLQVAVAAALQAQLQQPHIHSRQSGLPTMPCLCTHCLAALPVAVSLRVAVCAALEAQLRRPLTADDLPCQLCQPSARTPLLSCLNLWIVFAFCAEVQRSLTSGDPVACR